MSDSKLSPEERKIHPITPVRSKIETIGVGNLYFLVEEENKVEIESQHVPCSLANPKFQSKW